MHTFGTRSFPFVLVAIAAAGACARGATDDTATRTGAPATSGAEAAAEEPRIATARVEGGSGDEAVAGNVVFTEQPDGTVRVEATLSGLTPGPHGFHVHEVGDCTPPTYESAGGHFAMPDEHHAGPTAEGRHLGDLGNIEAGEEGTVRYTIASDAISLRDGDPTSVVGKSVVVHERRDDFTTQPSGDSGDRIACGVIEPLR